MRYIHCKLLAPLCSLRELKGLAWVTGLEPVCFKGVGVFIYEVLAIMKYWLSSEIRDSMRVG